LCRSLTGEMRSVSFLGTLLTKYSVVAVFTFFSFQVCRLLSGDRNNNKGLSNLATGGIAANWGLRGLRPANVQRTDGQTDRHLDDI